jgi:hypothetical protein
MIEIPTEHHYFVCGMKRGGHHAVINWLLGHSNSWIHHNNCILYGGKLHVVHESDLRSHGTEPHEMTIASFEDRPLFSESSFDLISKNFMPQKSNVLVLRDAYNTYASRFKKKRDPDAKPWSDKWGNFDDTSIWKNYAKEFLGITDKMNAIKINYNEWFSDTKYRRMISELFEFEFNDSGLQDVLDFGAGSSFDRMNFHRDAQRMDVLGRWKGFYRDKEYNEKIVSDIELKELNEKIFGFRLPKIHL